MEDVLVYYFVSRKHMEYGFRIQRLCDSALVVRAPPVSSSTCTSERGWCCGRSSKPGVTKSHSGPIPPDVRNFFAFFFCCSIANFHKSALCRQVRRYIISCDSSYFVRFKVPTLCFLSMKFERQVQNHLF